ETTAPQEPEQSREPSNAAQANAKRPPSHGPGATQVRTSDPNIVSPEPTVPPARAVSYQTSQLSGPPSEYPFGTGGGVERSGERANGEKHSDQQQPQQHGKHHHHKDHDDRHSHGDDHHGPRRKKHEKRKH